MQNAIKLGQAGNLLYGYQPVWSPAGGGVPYPFFPPTTESVVTFTPTYVPPAWDKWTATPTITIHDTATSLVSALYDYKLQKLAVDPAGIDVPAGPLVLGDADKSAAISAVGTLLGLDLTGDDSYMLVTMDRINGTAQHEIVAEPGAQDRDKYLTAAAKPIIDALVPAKPPVDGAVFYNSNISQADASAYVSAMFELGTHFVSEIVAGDRLIQVFSYADKQFKTLQSRFATEATTQPDGSKAVTGSNAAAWAFYTSEYQSNSGEDSGYVANYGTLYCLSQDPALDAAKTNKDWANGYVPDGISSIFAAATDYSLLTPLVLQVPITLTLSPLAGLIDDLLVAGPWDRLVKGGLLQKYGDAVKIPLKRDLDYEWSEIFPEAIESWTSNLVTPTIDIYQERVDLAEVKLQGTALVASKTALKSFTSFSQIMQSSTQVGDPPLALPSDSITLVSQIIDTSESAQTPVLQMSSNAFGKFTVICEYMYGALIFEDASNGERKVALDGYLFETGVVDTTSKRYKVDISGVFLDTPSAALVSQLSQSIQLSIVAGESLLNARGPDADTIIGIEVAYLNWLAGIIPADTDDVDLANSRARALYLANQVSTFGANTVYVPYVNYQTYTKYVGDMVTYARTLNQSIGNYQIQITDTINSYKVLDSIANLNDNIKQIGGVLTQYFKALADGRKAMDGYYDSILQQLDKELADTVAQIPILEGQLAAHQKTISNLGTPQGIVQRFQQDYIKYEEDLIAQAVVTGVEALFSLGVSMAGIPGAAEKGVLDALKAIKEVVDSLQAVMKVLASLSAIEAAADDAAKINALSNSIASESGQLTMPSSVNLRLMGQNVNAALANVPDTGSLNQDKADMIAAVNGLVIIGTALLEAQIKVSQILVEKTNINRKKTMNGQQEADISALTNALHLKDTSKAPDLSSIDLIGMTGKLQSQLKQVLTTIAQVLELQDGAIQYEYFGTPTPITSFTLLNLLQVIDSQDLSIINGLQNLNPPPKKVSTPIKVTVPNVLVSKLTGTHVFQVPIYLCASEFHNYDMVRIDRVVPNIRGIKSTASNSYEVHLSCLAKPFQDRDYHRQTMTYTSAARQFGPYVYDISSGDLTSADTSGTFADKVTHLTPFSQWVISLPGNVANNQDIEFDGLTVDIEFDFYITAHYDNPAQITPSVGNPGAIWDRAKPDDAVPMEGELMSASSATGIVAAADPNTPTLTNLLDNMYQNQAVLQGWDAVFNLLVGPVNAFLYYQFQQYVKTLSSTSTDNLMDINAYYCMNVVPQRGGIYATTTTQLAFKISNPLLEFIPGNDTVTVQQNILSGSIRTGTLYVSKDFNPGKCQLTSAEVNFTADTAASTLSLTVDDVYTDDMQVFLTSTGTLPAPLKAGNAQTGPFYWVISWQSVAGTTTLQLAEAPITSTSPGPAITLTSKGTGTHTISPAILWGDTNSVETSTNPYIEAYVPLNPLQGEVGKHVVYLDFPQGSFELNKVKVKNFDPSLQLTQISNALANFFNSHNIKYQVQTVDQTNLSGDVQLTPSVFALNAKTTNSKNNMLEILMLTGTKTAKDEPKSHSISLNEPIAYDRVNPQKGVSDFMVSLMISSELMFEHIFVDSFNPGSTNITVEGINPGQDFKAWKASVTSGTATGNAGFKSSYYIKGTETQFRITASSNNITWDLTGLEFRRSETNGLDLYYKKGDASAGTGGVTVPFEYRQWQPGSQYSPGYWGDWTKDSATAYVLVTGSYPLGVQGAGPTQAVKFTTTDPTVTVDKSSDLKPDGPCQCTDSDLKIAVLASLADAVPKTLKAYMEKITFKPVSIFALENLLFPAEQLITMNQAQVPADLLVVGSFYLAVRKSNPTYDVTISAAAGAKGVFAGTPFQNGVGTGSVTKSITGSSVVFTYGPIDAAVGGMVSYTIDIEAGTVSPPSLAVVVDQPDPDNNPATVVLLPDGWGPAASH